MKKKLILLGIAVALLALGIKFLPYHCNCNALLPQILAGRQTKQITLGNTTLTAVIADTDALREQGLSGVPGLPSNTGMLFIFDTPLTPGFWMKDMLFDLDMVWISADMQVVGIEKDALASSYPKVFFPPNVIKYVLEVPAGFSDAHNIIVGSKLSIGQ